MKFCNKCGREIIDEAVVCIHCGCYVNVNVGEINKILEDKADTALIVLSVLFPIVGLILWAIHNSDRPNSARSYGLAALIAFGVVVLLSISIYIFALGIMESLI